jgi:hypothetical protein
MPPTTSKESVLMAIRTAIVMAVIATGVVVGLLPTPAGAAKSQNCKFVSAGGHTYSVSAMNISCSFARESVAKLAGKRVSKRNNTLSGAPSGYKCLAASEEGDTLAKENHIPTNVQRLGNCAKGSGFGKDPYFNWSIQYTSG